MTYNKKFYEKYGLKITTELMLKPEERNLQKLSEQMFNALNNPNVSKQTVAELEGLVKKHPEYQPFRNYLHLGYVRLNDNKKAYQVLQQTFHDHPDYAFAHYNLAEHYVREGHFNKAAATLKEPYDIRHFEKDEFIHFSSYKNYYAVAIAIELARKNFAKATELHRPLYDFDPKHRDVKALATQIGVAKMRNNPLFGENASLFGKSPPQNRSVESISKPIAGTYLSDGKGKPIFNHIEIHELYEYGLESIPKSVIESILGLPRPTLIQDLEHVLMDTVLRYEHFQNKDWNEDTDYFCVHAIYLLTELKAEQSLPVLLNFLRQDEEFTEFWMSDGAETYIGCPIYLLGNQQLDALKALALEESMYYENRLYSCSVAVQVAIKQPERRSEVVSFFKDIIQTHLDNPDNDNLIDSEFLGFVISGIINFRGIELEEEIKALFATDWIDDSISGDLEEVLQELHKPFNPFYEDPMSKDIFELYSEKYEDRRAKSNDKEDTTFEDFLTDPYQQYMAEATPNILGSMLNKIFGDKDEDEDDEDYDDEDYDFHQPPPQETVKRETPKVGRNDLCPCGSGKKYKKCHGD